MNKPLYKAGDILYYVNPFVFIIDKVLIEFIDNDNDYGQLFYIDHSGAYLQEDNLSTTLSDAKGKAMLMLEAFYNKKQHEIWNAKPELEIQEND